MTNKEKAKTLVDGLGIIYTDCNRVTIKKLLIKMADWKDEQFLQWLKENLAKETSTIFTSESQGVINFEPVIKAFEKFIKQ